jgi:hypothetical protein
LLAKVQQVARLSLPPLPKFLMREGGGYSTFEVLSPRDDKDVVWHMEGDALVVIREMLPAVDDAWFTSLFGKRNASQLRCVGHLKGESFDIKDLQVKEGLKNKLAPDKKLLVVKAKCVPSQKLGSGDLYTVAAVFQEKDNIEEGYK